MFVNKSISILLSTITFILSSSIALAAENSSATFAGWPLLALLAAVIIFRKKIFAEATVQEPEAKTEQKADTEKKPAPSVKKAVKTSKAAAKPKEKSSSDSIDLNDDSKQCQASTAKGRRCKRTTTLEKTSIKIDGKTYHLTVCSQHNNDSLKPYAKLIKK